MLALVAGAAAASFALLVTRASDERERPRPVERWSEWRPRASGVEGAQEIADFVSQRYRLPSGRQLVAVQAGPLAIKDVPISAVAMESAAERADERKIQLTRVKNGLVFAMCGLGRRCSIAEGKPSRERGRLVRREALELALYAFKYVDGVDSVVTFLPPPRPSETPFVLYFRRSDLEDQLARPLARTLSNRTPPRPGRIDPAEAETVDRLTVPHVFGFGVQQLQDGSAMLVLARPTRA